MIISKLLRPRHNIYYLAETAVLTRLGVAGIRVFQNRPALNKSVEYTREDKYASFWERIFIEFLGTLGYMASIHLGMDGYAALVQRFDRKLKFPILSKSSMNEASLQNVAKEIYPQKPTALLKAVEKTAHDVYGEGKGGLIERAMFETKPPWAEMEFKLSENLKKLGISYDVLKEKSPKKMKLITTPLENFVKRVSLQCSMATVVGIITGAVFGGIVVQALNDRVVAPHVVPFLNRIFGVSNAPQPVVYENNPFASYRQPFYQQYDMSEKNRTFKF